MIERVRLIGGWIAGLIGIPALLYSCAGFDCIWEAAKITGAGAPMFSLVLDIVVATIGLGLYLGDSRQKGSEVGRIMLACGLLAFLLRVG